MPGILFWSWSIYDLLVLYWGESGTILLLTLLYFTLFGVGDNDSTQETERQLVPTWNELGERILVSGLLGLVLGLFWLVHGAVIGAIRKEFSFDTVPLDVKLMAVSSVLVALAASHTIRFGRDVYRTLSPQKVGSHYASTLIDRTVKLQVALLGTMFITIAIGFPWPLLVGVVLLKVIYELYITQTNDTNRAQNSV